MIGRTNTGGGGGLQDTDALLRVQAPAGSVVTITKGGMTKTDLGHENADDHTIYDYYFIIHQSQFDSQNAWTVTATLSGDTASDTIIIDAADEYDVELSYNLKLYWDGTNYQSIVQQTSTTFGGSSGTVTFDTSYIYWFYSGSTHWCFVVSNETIDFSDYSTLYITVETLQKKSSDSVWYFGLQTTKPTHFNAFAVSNNILSSLNVGETQTFSVDISSLNGSYYFGAVAESWSGGGNAEYKIHRIWAEK